MGLRSYRGPVETVAQAVMAQLALTITCQTCGHSRTVLAYRLCKQKKSAGALPLHKAVSGFYCRACHSKAKVVIRPEHSTLAFGRTNQPVKLDVEERRTVVKPGSRRRR